VDALGFDEQQTRTQCEQLELAWQVLNDATMELASRVATLPPDIFVSLRGAKELIDLCKSHPKISEVTPATIDSHEGYCVACCGSDIVARIKCELRSVEDLLVLKAVNELGSNDALKLQQKIMKAWQWTKPLTVTTR
jgi:hypothetical protein